MHTDEFEREAVSPPWGSGRPLTQVAAEPGIQPSMMRRRRGPADDASGPAVVPPPAAPRADRRKMMAWERLLAAPAESRRTRPRTGKIRRRCRGDTVVCALPKGRPSPALPPVELRSRHSAFGDPTVPMVTRSNPPPGAPGRIPGGHAAPLIPASARDTVPSATTAALNGAPAFVRAVVREKRWGRDRPVERGPGPGRHHRRPRHGGAGVEGRATSPWKTRPTASSTPRRGRPRRLPRDPASPGRPCSRWRVRTRHDRGRTRPIVDG